MNLLSCSSESSRCEAAMRAWRAAWVVLVSMPLVSTGSGRPDSRLTHRIAISRFERPAHNPLIFKKKVTERRKPRHKSENGVGIQAL
jgi:hypothetical protein